MTAPRLGAVSSDWPTRASERLVVDLADVTFMDSTGIGVLLNALRTSRRVMQMVLVCPTERVCCARSRSPGWLAT